MKYPEKNYVVGLALTSLLGACGGGGGDSFSDLETETDFGSPVSTEVSALSTLESAQRLSALASGEERLDANSPPLFFDAIDLFGENSSSSVKAQMQALSDSPHRFDNLETCLVEMTNRVEYNNCELSAEGTTVRVNGFVANAGNTVSLDLNYSTSFTGDTDLGISTNEFSITGELTDTGTAIEGRVDLNVTVGISVEDVSITTNIDSALIYDIIYEEDCVNGGEIRYGIDGSFSVRGGGTSESESFSGVARAEFGPGCNEVAVSARVDGTIGGLDLGSF